MEETLTLKLGEKRFKVDKQKLISKSAYFQSLCSHNFRDSKKVEHVINQNITPEVLQIFCTWLEKDDSCQEDYVQKFVIDNYKKLKELLEFAIFYAIDDLITKLSDLLLSKWVIPEYMIDILCLARKYDFNTSCDVIFFSCLKHITEIPRDVLLEAPIDIFLEIVENVNVKANLTFLKELAADRLTLEVEKDIICRLRNILSENKERSPKYLYCFLSDTVTVIDNKPVGSKVLYSFDNSNFEVKKLLEIWKQDSEKDIAGMQVIGQDFSIFKVGGEFGLGYGKFNTNVWRYCLLTKQWYQEVRHMAVAIINENLITLGGVGRYRLKLPDVEILDLKTKQWTPGLNIPETFTDVPPMCVIRGMIAICLSRIYIYNPTKDFWMKNCEPCHDLTSVGIKSLFAHGDKLYLGSEEGSISAFNVSWQTDNDFIFGFSLKPIIDFVEFNTKCKTMFEDSVVVGVCYDELQTTIEYGTVCETHFHTETHKSRSLPILSAGNCFRVIDPDSLYNSVNS